jgi:hypothetical protein
MKFRLETEPVLLGASAEKTALAPIDLKPAGGLRVLKGLRELALGDRAVNRPAARLSIPA